MNSESTERLFEIVKNCLGPAPTWSTWRGGWCDRVDLALLDAIYSTRQKYETTVLPRVTEWKELYPSSSFSDLVYLAEIDEAEIRRVFGGNVLPGVRIPGVRTGRRKSEGVKEVAQRLCSPEVGLKSARLIRDAVNRDGSDEVIQLLRKTKGVGPATASYFLMLLGVDGVKVDTLLGSWVRSQMGNPKLSDEQITQLVSRVAIEKFDRNARDLDYAIWRHESANRSGRSRKS
jgi:3-methyladenine DNA glycosylase/8-oxoguanine DNA glycosylase